MIAATGTWANINGAVIPAVSLTDTIATRTIRCTAFIPSVPAGELLVMIGTESTVSGGNSGAPSYMINPKWPR